LISSDRDVVAALERMIVQRIGEPRYNLWFTRHTKFSWEDDRLVVGVPNRFFLEWLQNTFAEAVRAAAAEVFDRPMQVRFTIDGELFQAARKEQAEVEKTLNSGRGTESPSSGIVNPSPEDRGQESAAPASTPRTPQRRWRHLSEFVVGACNRVAHASALSVVESPGQGPNPLVIHGPVGTGKTHLLEGVYSGLRRHHPDWRVCFVTAEDFTNRFVQAMRLGKLTPFRKHFRECDALLLDDLHFLAGKKATQEEFLHTFDVLQREGKQLVLTCDCHPRLNDDLMADVADRLLGGAVWGLLPPDPETRLAILRRLAAGSDPAVPENVLAHLVGQLRGNVRELEGALHSIRHYSRVAEKPVDLNLAREALADLLRHAVQVVQLSDVDRAVCRVLRLSAGSLQSRQRCWAVSHPRMLAVYLARKHTGAAYSEIGKYFGGRNHSTAVAAEKKLRQLLQEEGELVLGERRVRVRELIELVERELLK
jgi:chromosomal replication initiator protein